MSFPPRELETPRLRLRPPLPEDADRIFARYATDPEVTRWLTWRPHRDVGDTRAFVARVIAAWIAGRGHRAWLIERRPDGRLLGSIGFEEERGVVMLGYLLARDAWGHGYMTEAGRAVVDAARRDPRIRRVWAMCDLENRASARVLEKLGLRLESRLRRHLPNPNLGGQARDMLCFGLDVAGVDAATGDQGSRDAHP